MLANFHVRVNGTFHKIVRPQKSFAHRFVGNFTKEPPFLRAALPAMVSIPTLTGAYAFRPSFYAAGGKRFPSRRAFAIVSAPPR